MERGAPDFSVSFFPWDGAMVFADYTGFSLFALLVLCVLLSVFPWYVMSGVLSSCHRTVVSSQLIILEAASKNLAFSQ